MRWRLVGTNPNSTLRLLFCLGSSCSSIDTIRICFAQTKGVPPTTNSAGWSSDLNLRPRLCRSTTGAVLRFGLGRSVATGCEICWRGAHRRLYACRFGGRCLCCLHHLSSLLLVVLNVFSLEQTVPFKEHKHEQKHNKTS